MATQKNIAERLGISVSTVSAAYHRPKFVNAELRAKIFQMAQLLGYRQVKSGVTTFGIITPNLNDYFFGPYYHGILFGVLQRCMELGIRVQWFEGKPQHYEEIIDLQAIMLIGRPSQENLECLKSRKIPLIQVGCQSQDPTIPSVYFENYHVIHQLTTYALSLGHRHFALLAGTPTHNDPTWRRFYDGVQSAIGTDNTVRVETITANYSDVFSVEIALTSILNNQHKPTILMCANDAMAYYVIKFSQKYGIRIPKELSLTGFDGISVPPFLESPKPDLTTVYTDRTHLGRASIDVLITPMQGHKISDLVIPTELRIGDSVTRC